MDISFDSRVVLVSGAVHGIGRVFGGAFKELGVRVHLVDIDTEVRSAAEAIGGTGHVRDLSDRAVADALVQDIVRQDGRLDILALAVGEVCGQADTGLEDITEENWN